MSRRFARDDYTVGWICAVPVEFAAAKAVLDETHEELSMQPNDHNSYTLGKIGKHNVVITCLPNGVYGTTSATAVAMQLLSSFHSIRFGLMVGIGGGVPSSHADIRLGDIVVSMPIAGSSEGGVVQYDYGKALSGGHFQRTGMLSRPPQILLTSVAKLRGNHLLEESQVPKFLVEIISKYPRNSFNFRRPKEEDRLFEATYDHVPSTEACQDCDSRRTVSRPERDDDTPVVHYGLIASGNQVVKDSNVRDRLSQELGVLCVEMEAAGLMNNFPCLVIRGICDYADSHKNKAWQGYAAAAAAAYAKELLLVTSVVHKEPVREALSDSDKFRVPLDLSAVPAISEFLGRESDLDDLWEILRPREDNMRRVAVLHGLGGIGKTQLAIRFARIHKNDFTAVIWLNGKDQKTLIQSLASVLPRLPGIKEAGHRQNNAEFEKQAYQVLEWFSSEGNSKWLLIFDNVDQYVRDDSSDSEGYDVSTFFPRADQGSIVITTRLPEHSELGQSHPVRKLGVDEAANLLHETSGYKLNNKDTASDVYSDIRAVATRLDGLPLALVIAGVFIRNTGMGFTQYLQYYEKSWHQLQSKGQPQRHYFNGNLLATWEISLIEIQKRDPFAVNLLRLLSYYDNRDIWYELLEFGLQVEDLPEWLDTVMEDELSFLTTMKVLVSFSLVQTRHENGCYSLHPVIQDWCRHGLTHMEVNVENNDDKLKEIAIVSVGYCIPRTSVKEYWVLQRRLLPHADRMVNMVQNGWDIPQNKALLSAIGDIGYLYSNQGLLKEAKSMYKIAIRNKKNLLGENHVSILGTIQNLAILYVAEGSHDDAEPLFHEVLKGYENHYGSDHHTTLVAMNNLARYYSDLGEYSKAEHLFKRALAGLEKTDGPKHKSTLLAVYNIAGIYSHQQKWEEGEKMYLRALSGREELNGPDHPDTLRTVNNLGILYRRQGRIQEAEKMLRRALEGKEKTLGVDHRVTLRSASQLGTLFAEQGRLDEAEVLLRRAPVAYTKTFGEHHPKTQSATKRLRVVMERKSKT